MSLFLFFDYVQSLQYYVIVLHTVCKINMLEQKLKIAQFGMKLSHPAEIRCRFNKNQGCKSKYKSAGFTNLNIQRIVQHFEREKTLHHVH